MRNFSPGTRAFSLVVITFAFLAGLSCSNPRQANQSARPEEDGPREMLERDIRMMKDPALGIVPTERLVAAKAYRDELWRQQRPGAALSGVTWKNFGPNNQGGRSRTVLVDANDATGNTVWTGSVGGGLWKTTDISAASPAWTAVDDLMGNLSISDIVQDPSNTLVMYLSTGEGYGNIDGIRGLGVWKSVNGGTSWSQISATNNSNFYYCQKMAVTSTGVVLVATASGLQRSPDGGTTWTKVLGTGLGITGAASNFCYDVDIAANGDVFATLNGSVHRSTNAGVTFAAAQTLPITAGRIELATAPSDANYVYALCENGSAVAGVLKTVNGGTTWTSQTEPADADPGIPAADFSRTQAWYDLTIAVNPTNRDEIFVGGVDIFKSTNGGSTWTQVTHWYGGFGYQYAHADQHCIRFKPGSNTIAYFTNDGGIFQTSNANAASPTLTSKGTNYITAQFYSCAIHPTAQTSYYLAGAQDNGSHQFTSNSIAGSVQVTGGDGAFVHIDQDQPQYQFTSYVYNDFYRSSNGGASWTNVTTTGGDFISPTDYDNTGNILYMCDGNNNYRRWTNAQTGSTFSQVAVAAFNGFVTAVTVSPNTANRVFFGTSSGRVVRVDNANGAATATNISTGLPAGTPTCVEVETGNDNHLLVTYSNYGILNIWETSDGGTTWKSDDGNLPDMPVRWILLNPSNSAQAIIATELGVWSTDNLAGGATVWGASNSGLANVRVDMLQMRQSDKYVIAATHGRGLYGSDVFTTPTSLFTATNKTTYRNMAVQFNSESYRATSWSWDFGDGNTSTAENPSHVYANAGVYNVTLSINGGASSLTKNSFVQILPNRGTPYSIAGGGGFETNTADFGPQTTSGTAWELGNSAIAGKNGTHAGSAAWVTGLTASNYADNGDASLLTPNYNFTLPGTYTLRFWSKFATEAGYDGFRVEYSTNKGASWLPLGTTVAAGWYNFANTVGDASFPVNEAFFNGTVAAYTQYTRDVSFLAGQSNVSFRLRFKSDVNTNAAGVAVDDFEILGPANVSLPIHLLQFVAEKQQSDVLVKWSTAEETNMNRYLVERSTDGILFTQVGQKTALNGADNQYQFTDMISALPVRLSGYVYYRLKMLDKDGSYTYSSIARVALNEKADIVTAGPNPFKDRITIYSPSTVTKVSFYDAAGKMVYQDNAVRNNQVLVKGDLPKGTYILKIETITGVYRQKMVKMD
ncbi:MAG: T9SS type A sorting domain-containing protein [Chitinophagaceae bacterium]|nr:T9SS type A sorting domain-containing protein [Chitinophagaceae bacterium]